MSDFTNIRDRIAMFQDYENKLHLKQLQINNLLSITQAINNNHSANEIFEMYRTFLSFTMSIKKLALYFVENGHWNCVCHHGLPELFFANDATTVLEKITRLSDITKDTSDLLKPFDVVIPVFHKHTPIAHVLIGGFGDKDDRYDKIQFITTLTNVIAVAIENKRLFKKQLEQERFRQEMKLAHEMQMSLVPTKMPQGEKYELAAEYIPHLSVGGDLYDYIQFDDANRIVGCIADISGKGLAAALLMANFQANLRSIIRRRDSPDAFIRLLNSAIYRITNGDRYITFFIFEYDQRSQMLRYINAGHTPPLLLQHNKIIALDKGCTFLGWMPDLPSKIDVGEVQITDEALLVCFTDGITDACNDNKEMFGDESLATFIRNVGLCGAKDFNDKLIAKINNFKQNQDYTDDFTLLTLRMYA
jgi:phosphoserine phosphatase RsbU/P